MLRIQIAIAAIVAGVSGVANAYDIGHLTCENVGVLAAEMLMARQSGVPAEAYLSALNDKLPPDANVERQLAVDIAKVVYQSDEIVAMQPAEVYIAFAQNCVRAQERDLMSGRPQTAT